MSTFFQRLAEQSTQEPVTESQPTGGFFQRLSETPMASPPKEDAPWWKSIASPVAEFAEGVKNVTVDPFMAAFNPRRTLRADEDTGRLVAEHIPKEEFKEGTPQLGEQWQSLLKNLREGQDEAGNVRSDIARRIGQWSLIGTAAPALGTAEYALEQGLKQQLGEGASKTAPWLVAAFDIFRSIKQNKPPSSDTMKLLSGLSERPIYEATTEQLAKRGATRAQKMGTKEAIKQEAQQIITQLTEEALPLTKTEKNASALMDYGAQLLEDAESSLASSTGQERHVFSDEKGGILNFLRDKLKQVTKSIVSPSEETSELINTINKQKNAWGKFEHPQNITDAQAAKLVKKKGVNQEMVYKQTKENNKIINREYKKAPGERNEQKIQFLTEMNDMLLQQLEKMPNSEAVVDTVKTANEYYKQGIRYSQAENLLKSVMTESGNPAHLKNVLSNRKSANQLKRILGGKRFSQLEKVSSDISRYDKNLNAMRTRNKLFTLYDGILSFFSPTYAKLHAAAKIPGWFRNRYLLSPKMQKQSTILARSLRNNNSQKALSALFNMEQIGKEEEQRYQEFEKSLIK